MVGQGRKLEKLLLGCIVFVLILYSGCIQLGEKPPAGKGVLNLTKKYSKFGFSFWYPEGMEISETGFLGDNPDDTSGIIMGEYYFDGGDQALFIKISWIKMPTPSAPEEEYEILEVGINASFDLIAEVIETAKNFTKEEKGEIKINNRKVLYQKYLLDFSTDEYPNKVLYGVAGSFYCYKNKKSYTFNLAYSKDKNEAFLLFKDFLENFDCY